MCWRGWVCVCGVSEVKFGSVVFGFLFCWCCFIGLVGFVWCVVVVSSFGFKERFEEYWVGILI